MIININESTIKAFIESVRPKDEAIRAQVDFGYSYDGQIIEMYEIRPLWSNPTEKQHIPFVKIRFYKSTKTWNLYWMRANEKWEIYEPFPKSTHLDKIIDVIKKDKHACFFG